VKPRLVDSMSVSVDGFIADREGAFGWTAPSSGSALLIPNLRHAAARAGVRRWFAPHRLRHAHAVEMAREGVALIGIQRQLVPHQPRDCLDLHARHRHHRDHRHHRRAPTPDGPVDATLRM
jgi:hypothetical protein